MLNMQWTTRNLEEALNDYDKALELKYPNAFYNKANILVSMGRFEEACQCYRDARNNNVNNKGIANNLSHTELISDITHSRKYDLEIRKFEMSGGIREISIIIQDYEGERKSLLFVGFIGNTGNHGASGLPGGRGYFGAGRILVHLEAKQQDADEK